MRRAVFSKWPKPLSTDRFVQPSNIGQPEKVQVLAEGPKVSTESTPRSDPKNYSSCMNGFSYACNKALLTSEEAAAVGANDLRRNYSSCLSSFFYACNKKLLTPDKLSKVQASDLRRNYSACKNGISYARNRHLLTSDQLLEVEAKEQGRRE